MSDVFIAGTATRLPQLFPAEFVADQFYPRRLCSERITALATRVCGKFGIKERAVSIDMDRIPEKVLKDKRDHPLAWCVSVIQDLTRTVPVDEIGFLGVAYNTSLHTNNLPNLACQAAMRAGINPEIAPVEFANYGCAGGLFPLESAVEYCRRNQKAAIVIAFDQCTSRASFCHNPDDPMFKMDIKVNLLFSDGAVGILIVPQRLRDLFPQKLPKIQDVLTAFKLSELIRFDDTRFVLGDRVWDDVPPFVAESVIRPVLARNGLSHSEVSEWSVHQGSRDILTRFGEPEVLGLTTDQLARSKELFERYGNLSAPSCFLVLDSFFKNGGGDEIGTRGMVVGFGAGFYQASVLYQWD
jgi:predicted naringenin-chalcone synthase